ncbi:Hypothetical protein D9617_16g014890 [Elsinoe fawcettii]|nr:Hypothetical protein D9617_16g014890 [Elsinoe fawcettii]
MASHYHHSDLYHPRHAPAFAIPDFVEHDIRSTAGQRVDKSRFRISLSLPQSQRISPPETQYKRVFDNIGGNWYNIEINPDGTEIPATDDMAPRPGLPKFQSSSTASPQPKFSSAEKRKASINLSGDDDDGRPKRRTYIDLEGSPKRKRTTFVDITSDDDPPTSKRPRTSDRYTTTSSERAYDRNTKAKDLRKNSTSANNGDRNCGVTVVSGCLRGFDPERTFLRAWEAPRPQRKPEPARRAVPRRKNHAFVEEDSDTADDGQRTDDENTMDEDLLPLPSEPVFIRRSGSKQPSPRKPGDDESLKVLREMAEDLQRSEGLTFIKRENDDEPDIIRDPGMTFDLTKSDDDSPTTTPSSSAKINKPVPGMTRPAQIGPPQQIPSDVGDHQRPSPISTTLGTVARPPKAHSPKKSSKEGTALNPLKTAASCFSAEKTIPKPSQNQSPFSSIAAAPKHGSYPPKIPDRLRRDNDWIKPAARGAHQIAGSERSTAGVASRSGFIFKRTQRPNISPPKVSQPAATSSTFRSFGSDSTTSSSSMLPQRRDGPMSFRRRAALDAELEDTSGPSSPSHEGLSDTEPSGPPQTHPYGPPTSSKRTTTHDPVYNARLRTWQKPSPLTDVDDYIRDGAEREIYARSIADRINKAWGLGAENRWTPTMVQARAQELTGKIIKLREKQKKKPKKATEIAEEDETEVTAPKKGMVFKEKGDGDRKQENERRAYGEKRPLGEVLGVSDAEWEVAYRSALTGLQTEDEKQGLTHDQIYQPFVLGEDQTKLAPRPKNHYYLHCSLVSKKAMPVDYGQEELDEALERNEHLQKVYTDRAQAIADCATRSGAIIASHATATEDITTRRCAGDDLLPVFTTESERFIVRARLEKKSVWDTLPLPKEACRRPGKFWELKETVKLIWVGKDAGSEVYGRYSTQSMTAQPMSRAQTEATQGSHGCSSAEEIDSMEFGVGEEQAGESIEGGGEKLGEGVSEAPTEAGRLVGSKVDLFGEENTSGDVLASTISNVLANDHDKEVQDINYALLSETQTETQAPKVQEAEGQEASQEDKSNHKLRLSKKAIGRFDTLEEANYFAKGHILTKMILPFPSRHVAGNLDRRGLWEAQKKADWIERLKAVDQNKDMMREEKLTTATANDFPSGFVPDADEVAGYAKVWKIKVVARGLNGAVN